MLKKNSTFILVTLFLIYLSQSLTHADNPFSLSSGFINPNPNLQNWSLLLQFSNSLDQNQVSVPADIVVRGSVTTTCSNGLPNKALSVFYNESSFSAYLTCPIVYGETVTVDYTNNTGWLRDLSGNIMDSFNNFSITNSTIGYGDEFCSGIRPLGTTLWTPGSSSDPWRSWSDTTGLFGPFLGCTYYISCSLGNICGPGNSCPLGTIRNLDNICVASLWGGITPLPVINISLGSGIFLWVVAPLLEVSAPSIWGSGGWIGGTSSGGISPALPENNPPTTIQTPSTHPVDTPVKDVEVLDKIPLNTGNILDTPVDSGHVESPLVNLKNIIARSTEFADEKYIVQSITLSRKNSSEDVIKLQEFFNTHEGEKFTLTGVYDAATIDAVNRFQLKYAEEILKPWGIKKPTGNVGITTRAKINTIAFGADKKIACTPLTDSMKLWDSSPDVPALRTLLLSLWHANFTDSSSFLYDESVQEWVKKFQTAYADDILKPLGLQQATGNWFSSSRYTANLIIWCDRPERSSSGRLIYWSQIVSR